MLDALIEIGRLEREKAKLYDDRDCEKQLRKDAEHALADAAEIIEDIMKDRCNAVDECEKWLRQYDPIRLEGL